MPRPQQVAAAEESCHQVFSKAGFVGGKPGRRRAAEEGRALPAHLIVPYVGFQISEDLPETHFFQSGLVAFGRTLLSVTPIVAPEPVIDQAVLGNQPVHLFRSQAAGRVVGPAIRGLLLLESDASNRLQQHIAP